MFRISRNLLWGGGIIGTLLLTVAGVYLSRQSERPLPVETVKSSGVAMEIQGLKYSNYKEGKLQSRVQAGQLIVVPRKIGIFQIQSINEAVISQFRLEILNEPVKASSATSTDLPLELADGIKGLAAIKGSGRITKVTIAGMTIISLQDNQPNFILNAKVGVFDARQKQLQLEQVILQKPSLGMKIVTERAVWNKKINAFEIPGPYEIHKSDGIQKGERVYVDMNFRLIFDKGSIKPKQGK